MAAITSAAIDLGATSGRVILGTYAKNRLTLEEVHRFPNSFRSLNGSDYWDLPGLFAEIKTGLFKAKQRAPKLASVGVDTWGVDYVLVNDAGRLVFPAHAYRDRRTEPFYEQLKGGSLERIYEATGLPNLSYNTSVQLQEAVTSCPALEDLATRCLFLPDYFNFLLSGKMENEFSIASTSQLIDVHGKVFSRTALSYFRVPSNWLTTPLLSPKFIGRIASRVPELSDVKVVAVPRHDTSCAYDAMPASPDGTDIYISSGTWSLVGFETTGPIVGPEALRIGISNERTGDGRYRPNKGCLGLWLLEQTLTAFSARPTSAKEWSALIDAAEKLPAPKGLIDISDHSLFNPASMRAAIDAQLKRKKIPAPKTLAGYVRLICDSLGQGHGNAVKNFERLTGKKFKRVLMIGGGSKNRLLCQATADACGLPVAAFDLEGSAVGNLANQFIALGAVKNLAQFRANLSRTLAKKIYNPR